MPTIERDVKLDFADVLIRPKRSSLNSRSKVELTREFRFLHSGATWRGIPLTASNMDTTGTFAMAESLSTQQMLVAIHKHYSLEEWIRFYERAPKEVFNHVMCSTGTSEEDFFKVREITKLIPELKFICIDIANGYSEHFLVFIQRLRQTFPNHVLVAGNVVTPEMVESILLAGADVVKIGIGPGLVCTTREKTGIGYPQLSAILECADAAHHMGGLLMSDGGCRTPGDISKAFGAGADFVMLGGMFAGHDESGGEKTTNAFGETVKAFYGMSSTQAMRKYSTSAVKDYRASEGKSIEVEYKGPVSTTVSDILGGLRSTCTYIGATKLKEVPKRTTFILKK